MRYLGWIVALPLVVTAVVFAVHNLTPQILDLWPLPYTLEAPLYAVIMASLALGGLGGGALAWIGGGPRRRRARANARERRRLAKEVEDMRARMAQEGGDDGALPARGDRLPPLGGPPA